LQLVDLADEDRARADCYALISRLFYAPPEGDLLQRLGDAAQPRGESDAVAPEENDKPAAYEQAFMALQRACRSTDAGAVREEFDNLFVGAGKALVTPYTSGYAMPNAPDRYLVALRERLAAFGLVRAASAFEIEDHVSAVCDVMRWLIEDGRPLDAQRAFFDEFVYMGLGAFCAAIDASTHASFYRKVAAVAAVFLSIEQEGFNIEAQR
jgi:TorA maturation chaperone TorD